MSVMELGPDDGQFEFKHILPNKYAQLSVDKPEDMLEFNAKRRYLISHVNNNNNQ